MEDLEARKVYQILLDREAAREGYIRVVDESRRKSLSDLSVSSKRGNREGNRALRGVFPLYSALI